METNPNLDTAILAVQLDGGYQAVIENINRFFNETTTLQKANGTKPGWSLSLLAVQTKVPPGELPKVVAQASYLPDVKEWDCHNYVNGSHVQAKNVEEVRRFLTIWFDASVEVSFSIW